MGRFNGFRGIIKSRWSLCCMIYVFLCRKWRAKQFVVTSLPLYGRWLKLRNLPVESLKFFRNFKDSQNNFKDWNCCTICCTRCTNLFSVSSTTTWNNWAEWTTIIQRESWALGICCRICGWNYRVPSCIWQSVCSWESLLKLWRQHLLVSLVFVGE